EQRRGTPPGTLEGGSTRAAGGGGEAALARSQPWRISGPSTHPSGLHWSAAPRKGRLAPRTQVRAASAVSQSCPSASMATPRSPTRRTPAILPSGATGGTPCGPGRSVVDANVAPPSVERNVRHTLGAGSSGE